MSDPRIVCRFSCGAASAVATKLALRKYDPDRVAITYSNPGSEHPDNVRFLADCQRWFNHEIIVLKSDEYADTWQVWDQSNFIVSRHGAACTGLMKREPTYAFSRPDDVLVFGYTTEERGRAEQFRKQNFEVAFETPLIDAGLTKVDCLAMIERAGIELPAMYRLGYHNNNCIGCPKGGMGYWNKIRVDFPEVFERMSILQRRLGKGSGFWRERDTGERITLDELAPDRGNHNSEPNVECSLMCHLAELGAEDDSEAA
jgi:3'-phosphoadenosine 5'-phosphosulfate sulfotransferase (PAPS reductase)/FAD synthetase